MTEWIPMQNAASIARRALAADFDGQGDDLIGLFGTGAELTNEQALGSWLRQGRWLYHHWLGLGNTPLEGGLRAYLLKLATSPAERELPLIDLRESYDHPHALGDSERLIIARTLQCLLRCRREHREAEAYLADCLEQRAPLLDQLLLWLQREDPRYADFPTELTMPLFQTLVWRLEENRLTQAAVRDELDHYANVYALRPVSANYIRNAFMQQRYRGPWFGWDSLIEQGKSYVRVSLRLLRSLSVELPYLVWRSRGQSVLDEWDDIPETVDIPNTDAAVTAGWLVDTALTWLRRAGVEIEARRRIGLAEHTQWLAVLAIAEALQYCPPGDREEGLAKTPVLPTGETALALLNAGQPGKLLRHLQRFGLARRW